MTTCKVLHLVDDRPAQDRWCLAYISVTTPLTTPVRTGVKIIPVLRNPAADHSDQTDEVGNRTNTSYSNGDNNRILSDGIHDYTCDNEGNRTASRRNQQKLACAPLAMPATSRLARIAARR